MRMKTQYKLIVLIIAFAVLVAALTMYSDDAWGAIGGPIDVQVGFGATADSVAMIHYTDSTSDTTEYQDVAAIDTTMSSPDTGLHIVYVQSKIDSNDDWATDAVIVLNNEADGEVNQIPVVFRCESADSGMFIFDDIDAADTVKYGTFTGLDTIVAGPFDSLTTISIFLKWESTGEWEGGEYFTVDARASVGDTVYSPTPATAGYANVYGYLKTADGTVIDGATITAIPSHQKLATDTTSGNGVFVLSDPVGTQTDTTGYFSITLMRTGSYDDTAKGFYKVNYNNSGTPVNLVQKLYIGPTGDVDLGEYISER